MPYATIQRARNLILQYGWNSSSYQIINPGIELCFSKKLDAVIGYVRQNRVLFVAAAPVCREEDLENIVDEFENNFGRNYKSICYFAAESRFVHYCNSKQNYSKIIIGLQPSWNPQAWGEIMSSVSSLRAQINRAKNKKVTVHEKQTINDGEKSELQSCLAEWLSSKNLPPLHFLVESDTLDRIFDRRIFIAVHNNRVVGFVVLSPITQRHGWLIEQIIRTKSAPNGTTELMIHHIMQTMAKEGYHYITMGLIPLATKSSEYFKNSNHMQFVLSLVKKFGKKFYNFEGLESFKLKFRPTTLEPIFAISNTEKFSLRILFDLSAAFTKQNPFMVFIKGVTKIIFS